MHAVAHGSDVLTLGRRRAHQAISDARGIEKHTLGFRVVRRVVPFLLARVFGRKLRQAQSRMLDQAVWFRGARESIETQLESDGLLDSDSRLQKLLESVEASIVRMRASLSTLMEHTSAFDSEQADVWHDLCADIMASSSELARTVSDFKWAVLEHDASHSKHIDGFSARSKEELDALIDRMIDA